MSFLTPKYIIRALQSSEGVMGDVGGRIYYVGRDNSAEAEDKIPYIVVEPSGISATGSKDGFCEDEDKVNVLVVAESGEALMSLCTDVRQSVRDKVLGEEVQGLLVSQVDFSASGVFFDPAKPCYYQTINYTLYTSEL